MELTKAHLFCCLHMPETACLIQDKDVRLTELCFLILFTIQLSPSWNTSFLTLCLSDLGLVFTVFISMQLMSYPQAQWRQGTLVLLWGKLGKVSTIPSLWLMLPSLPPGKTKYLVSTVFSPLDSSWTLVTLRKNTPLLAVRQGPSFYY